eukprot:6205986-Pleurochrysis_carterae.AAC.2
MHGVGRVAQEEGAWAYAQRRLRCRRCVGACACACARCTCRVGMSVRACVRASARASMHLREFVLRSATSSHLRGANVRQFEHARLVRKAEDHAGARAHLDVVNAWLTYS